MIYSVTFIEQNVLLVAVGQFEIRMMEQAQMHGVHPAAMYDPRAMEQMRNHPAYAHGQGQFPFPQEHVASQSGEYSTKQTIMSDFETARQMRHPSPTEHKDMRQQRDPRDPRDQSISPRAPEHVQQGPSSTQKGYFDARGYPIPGPGAMYMAPGGQPHPGQGHPGQGHPGQGQQPPSSSR